MSKICSAGSVVVALLGAVSTASPIEKRAFDKEHYANNAGLAAFALQGFWYNEGNGLWDNAWWNSGNALTTLADWGSLRPIEADSLNLKDVIQNTWVQAQRADVFTSKIKTSSGMVNSTTCVNGRGPACAAAEAATAASASALEGRMYRNFINTFYDDEAWWALGLIRSYDYTHKQEYLDSAVTIFNDMQGGRGTPCGGGIYWNKDRHYVNAIANELYLAVAASLANRIQNDKSKYTQIAEDQWTWFANSGMINGDNMINDGLDDNCRNNGQQTWTYNQGVVLGGLAELYKATGNNDYLNRAHQLASASMSRLVNGDGILMEANKCENDPNDRCHGDGAQFKGIYARNLRYLHDVSPSDDIKNFLTRNADSVFQNDRQDNKLGPAWPGPYYAASGNSHSSAMDVLVGAIAVA